MCLFVYIASDQPLPEIPWDTNAPGFHVKNSEAETEPIRGRLPFPHQAYAGSHEGCGCGFQFGEYPDFEKPEDVQLAQKSRAALAAYLQSRLTQGAQIALYACWDGDQEKPEQQRSVISPAELLTTKTFFQERELLLIEKDPR